MNGNKEVLSVSATLIRGVRPPAEGGETCHFLCSRTDQELLRPLWLTPQEANLLLQLCLTSDMAIGEEEHELLHKLGDFLRQQNRASACLPSSV